MKTRLLIAFNAILALFAVHLLVACQPNKSETPATQAFGTSDSGGGTGINNKVYESYIVDIQKHRAFTTYVLPLISNIKSDPRKSEGKDTFPAFFKSFTLYKTWYIAPIDLEKIGKETLGVSHQKSDTQQIARQTKKEIWIDSRIFEKMTEKDQGDLILHEIIMSAYFTQFMNLKELCLAQILTLPKEGSTTEFYSCDGFPEKYNDYFKNVPWRPLNAEDNENIRYVTGWLLINAQQPVSESEVMKVFSLKGFDRRAFNTRSQEPNEDLSRKMRGRDIMNALKGTELSGFMPDICKDIGSDHKENCRLEASEGKIKHQNIDLPTIVLNLYKDDKLLHRFESLMADEQYVSGIRDEDGTVVTTFTMVSLSQGLEGVIGNRKVKVGDRSTYAFLNFRPGNGRDNSLRLDSVIIRPTLLVSIDKTRKEICEFRIPRRLKPYDSGIFIQRQDTKMEIAETAMQSIENLGYCSAEMVD